ncbi:uncharacterized protein J4E92_001202 [Alternaria infectoria]|uniref:uncharacterized protein n=1 Tax=Alternaria infectoria TaxID=45303 RepID=UPI00221FC0C6|nr:uncharacterized protein J4E92_001202 [Alternaria infectoria]KAI4939915.1 hypothetical protein J4E92_001202 [Alternaria infectoria]
MAQLNQPPNKPAKARVEGLGDISLPSVQSMSLPRPPPNPVPDLMDLVINRESRYTTHSLITSYLGIDDIRNVQLACRKTSDLYANMKKTQWNINTSLQPFFKNTQTFRSVQAQTETLIGSKFAGKFFRRLQVKNELQLFTQAGEKADALISYLEQDGYVFDFGVEGGSVEFGSSKTDYPRTIAAIKCDSEEGLIVKTGEWMIKNDKIHPEFTFARSVSDKLSWVIKLDTTDVSHATTPDSLLDDARFSVEVTSQSSIVSYLKLRYDVLASCSLQHTYICLARNYFEPAVEGGERRRRQYEAQIRQLEQVLHAETSMQLTMLDPDDRPPQYATIASRRGKDHTAKGHFKAPPTWNYFDAEIQVELRRITEQLLATGPPK